MVTLDDIHCTSEMNVKKVENIKEFLFSKVTGARKRFKNCYIFTYCIRIKHVRDKYIDNFVHFFGSQRSSRSTYFTSSTSDAKGFFFSWFVSRSSSLITAERITQTAVYSRQVFAKFILTDS